MIYVAALACLVSALIAAADHNWSAVLGWVTAMFFALTLAAGRDL